jgi:hypothetical protein
MRGSFPFAALRVRMMTKSVGATVLILLQLDEEERDFCRVMDE